ncbi:hypothetical protein IX306_000012 [Porphyromonas levii]|nr:hypothetical protein [Porphyromonas levii]MBR8772912.1 hypothetical protein [Porphyromonas levii]
MNQCDMENIISTEVVKRESELVAHKGYFLDVVRIQGYDKSGVLRSDEMLCGVAKHGVSIYYPRTDNGTNIVREVWFGGEKMNVQKGVSADIGFVESLEDFFLKDAMREIARHNPFVDDSQLLLPLFKKVGNLETCLEDLVENGLDAESFQDVGIFPYERDFTKQFYFDNFKGFEDERFDLSEIGEVYSYSFAKTIPDVIISETLKQTASEFEYRLPEQLRITLDSYVPHLDDHTLDLVHNLLKTNRHEIKDRVDIECNCRHPSKTNQIADEMKKEGKSLNFAPSKHGRGRGM